MWTKLSMQVFNPLDCFMTRSLTEIPNPSLLEISPWTGGISHGKKYFFIFIENEIIIQSFIPPITNSKMQTCLTRRTFPLGNRYFSSSEWKPSWPLEIRLERVAFESSEMDDVSQQFSSWWICLMWFLLDSQALLSDVIDVGFADRKAPWQETKMFNGFSPTFRQVPAWCNWSQIRW